LILAIGIIPSLFEHEAEANYLLFSAVIVGVLSMYWILIPYVAGVYLLFSLFRFGARCFEVTPVRTLAKITAASLIMNPFIVIFLCLHGAEIVTTTSQFTNNIPRYPSLEEILGFARHFSLLNGDTASSVLMPAITMLSILVIAVGCFARFADRDYLFISSLAFFSLFGFLFYYVDFTYHFYKNAVLGTFLLLMAIVAGVGWSLTRASLKILTRTLLIAFICVFVSINMRTWISFTRESYPVVDRSLISLTEVVKDIPSDSLILVNSSDPTEEAWISYFLREKKIKLEGSIEPWGFWILAPFSGNANANFFFDPESDVIDYTLSPKFEHADIIRSEARQSIASNAGYILTKGLPDPFLFKGWYPPEESGNGVGRWTGSEGSILLGKADQDYLLEITGEIPTCYAGDPPTIQLLLNDQLIDTVESDPAYFTQKSLLTKDLTTRIYNELTLDLDKTFSPDNIMKNGDKRSLGVMVRSIKLLPGELFGIDYPIDVGSPEFDPYLMQGWSFNEVLEDGTTFRWVQGKNASLTVFLIDTANLKMELKALPFLYPNSPLQEVTVSINDHVVGRIGMANATWQLFEVDIPRNILRKGLNTIDLMFSSSASPSEVSTDSADPRSLSVAFDVIGFRHGLTRMDTD
ncbi:MAG: hypothetical protein RBS57_14430, partial [Desulforhabdus sp.]|jgi:hypothetical protein|nr:hypothetical protein [Desulforhabdus sp.]